MDQSGGYYISLGDSDKKIESISLHGQNSKDIRYRSNACTQAKWSRM